MATYKFANEVKEDGFDSSETLLNSCAKRKFKFVPLNRRKPRVNQLEAPTFSLISISLGGAVVAVRGCFAHKDRNQCAIMADLLYLIHGVYLICLSRLPRRPLRHI